MDGVEGIGPALMDSTTKFHMPPLIATEGHQWSTEPPTQPGTYWFRPEPLTRALMVEVRVTNGALTILWPNIDQPVTKFCRMPSLPRSSVASRLVSGCTDLFLFPAKDATQRNSHPLHPQGDQI